MPKAGSIQVLSHFVSLSIRIPFPKQYMDGVSNVVSLLFQCIPTLFPMNSMRYAKQREIQIRLSPHFYEIFTLRDPTAIVSFLLENTLCENQKRFLTSGMSSRRKNNRDFFSLMYQIEQQFILFAPPCRNIQLDLDRLGLWYLHNYNLQTNYIRYLGRSLN